MNRGLRVILCLLPVLVGLFLSGCRGDPPVIPTTHSDIEGIDPLVREAYEGMYVLNEGNMGSNKSSLDYIDFQTGVYHRNIFAERNPSMVKELGDVGNDMQIYGNKLYLVINCSHKVDVLDLYTGKHLAKIDIPNCRYIRFHDGKGYVSSYVVPVGLNSDAGLGAVYRIDTGTYAIEASVEVGYQPEELVIHDGRIYVANSGGYRAPNYDNRVTVIDLQKFEVVETIAVYKNLHRLRVDGQGRLWVSSRGDYSGTPSRLFQLERPAGERSYRVTDTVERGCSNLCIVDNNLYFFSVEWRSGAGSNSVSYGVFDVTDPNRVVGSLITDGTEGEIKVPYGILVNPVNKEMYITDAKKYVSAGDLRCYDASGKFLWKVETGDIPAHMVLVPKRK